MSLLPRCVVLVFGGAEMRYRHVLRYRCVSRSRRICRSDMHSIVGGELRVES
jgi:hypothetical protein